MLLVEQNLGVAIGVADEVSVMVNGRIARTLSSGELASDLDLQQRLLGIRSSGEEDEELEAPAQLREAAAEEAANVVYTVRRAGLELPEAELDDAPRSVRAFTRWNAADALEAPRDRLIEGFARAPAPAATSAPAQPAPLVPRGPSAVPVARTTDRAAYIAGTFDTKGRELLFLKSCIERWACAR